MNREELLELRNQIVAQTKVVAMEGSGPAEDRLPIVLELARGGDAGLLRKAFELANSIGDEVEKLNALLDIIAVIDENLAVDEDDSAGEIRQTPAT